VTEKANLIELTGKLNPDMPKKTIRKFMPHPARITENPMIKKLGPRLQDPGIWHVNRRSVSGAVAVGLFCAFIPVPFQMLLGAIGAILFRVNILISVPMVWISNPLTMPPLFYFCYRIGALMLGSSNKGFNFELSFNWLANGLLLIWQPFLLGCLVVGICSALLGYWMVRLLWRYEVTRKMKKRQERPNSSPHN
jgi:uncharacterized protein (DUF2062 family)